MWTESTLSALKRSRLFCGSQPMPELESWRRRRPCSGRTIPNFASWLPTALPRGWSFPRHLKLIAAELDRVWSGETDRLAIHMPPRHGKSETVSVRFCVYALLADPSAQVLVTGYNERFARRLSRKARTLAREVGLRISDEAAAADEWHTDSGGLLMARGVGSPPTGTGFRLIVVDDPIRSREDAESEAHRERAWDWYADDLYTRLEPGGAIVLVATRWRHDDVCARMVESEPERWRVVSLPAIAEDHDDPLGRAPGEALWPERWPAEELLRRREVMRRLDGDHSWQALFQQRPTPREGALFQVSRLRTVESSPGGLARVRAWDVAATAKAGDWTVGVLMAGPDAAGAYYVVDVVRARLDSGERDALMRRTAWADGPETLQVVPQDPGAAGKSLAAHFVRLLAGRDVRVERQSGDKAVRAGPLASQVAAGNVAMVSAPWNAEFVEELRQFPLGRHDDQVDAAASAFNRLAESGAAVRDDEMWARWRLG